MDDGPPPGRRAINYVQCFPRREWLSHVADTDADPGHTSDADERRRIVRVAAGRTVGEIGGGAAITLPLEVKVVLVRAQAPGEDTSGIGTRVGGIVRRNGGGRDATDYVAVHDVR